MFSKTTLNRWIFIIISFFIISLILWNTSLLFDQLKENERTKMQIWASALQEIEELKLSNNAELSEIVVQVLSSNTTTPMILHTYNGDLYSVRNITEKTKDTAKLRVQRIEMAEQFAQEYKPLEITFNNELLTTIYYGNSPLIRSLKYYPAILILILFLCFAVMYFFYKTSKSSEQNKLWAGMAKETAHQIGTPLSSLVGWAEILKTENVDPDYIVEIEKDIDRLKTITERFSKVGSVPKLERKNIITETQEAYDYLKRRSSKLIHFSIDVPSKDLYVNLNEQLYSWVIENLVKNGIDAMKGKGAIHVSISYNSKYALINISDTGKGIPKNKQRHIFRPGYTTKKRGWGLGLSLAKRIIDEYHNGKIRVSKSTLGKGSTIEIALLIVK